MYLSKLIYEYLDIGIHRLWLIISGVNCVLLGYTCIIGLYIIGIIETVMQHQYLQVIQQAIMHQYHQQILQIQCDFATRYHQKRYEKN